MRSMWNGTISFGLVNIPVGLYPATADDRVHFNMLHKEDGGRIKNQRVCAKCGDPVSYDELEKGFEYEKDHYVTLSDEELKSAQAESTETITIMAFADLEEIDPIFFDQPYYLIPGKKSDKVYALLRDTLKKTGKVGIARFVLRTREYLAALRVRGDALVLDTMHFSEEIRDAEGVPAADEKANERELAMATQLVDAMTEKFDPEKYHDTYEEAVMELINRKLEGKAIKSKTKQPEPTNVLDLMSRLKASLEKADGGVEEEEKPAKAKTTKAAAPKAKTAARPAAKRAKSTTRKPADGKRLKLVA